MIDGPRAAPLPARESFRCLPSGEVIVRVPQCTCVFPENPNNGMHETYCGKELIGLLPEEAARAPHSDPYMESDLLPTMLWDFAGFPL